MQPRPQKKRRRKARTRPGPPSPLSRAPRTDLQARVGDLDKRMFTAVAAVVEHLTGDIDESLSLDHMKLLMTKAHLLLAMKSTHRSIRHLVGLGQDQADLTVDTLALTRIQLERCFLALLLEDNPKRWHVRYRKNAWKAFAQKFFRDQRILGKFKPFGEYFGPSGKGVGMLRDFAREMNVWEDEFQTLRTEVLDDEPDPRWSRRQIVDMPHPAHTPAELKDPARQELARLLYPYYSNLSSFSHGGLAGVMTAALLRPDFAPAGKAQFDKQRFWARNVLETVLPGSYVAVLLVATLFAEPFLAGDEGKKLRTGLTGAWCPYHRDGSALGVALWDAWAGKVLQGEPAAGEG